MSFHKEQALDLFEINNVWHKLKEVPGFDNLNFSTFERHVTVEGFNKYLFWEDMILLAGETVSNQEQA